MPINSKTYGKLSRAFTLIELLAVIVILAVIALITIPLLLNVVDKSQKNAFVDSAYGIIEAGKLYYMENISGKELASRTDFKVSDGKFILGTDATKELKFSGTMPKTGMLQLHPNGDVAIAICNDTYCACKSISELKVTLKDSNCNINSETGEIGKEDSISEQKLKELESKIVALEKDKVKAGTVISYMGKNIPDGYLSCDGTVYNISDYKDLAEQIKANFGSYNYFGGNGTTTFAVPDLRGEFLRGTGTATRNTGSGSVVGKHQDATNHTNNFGYYINESSMGIATLIAKKGISGTHTNVDLEERNQDRGYGSSIGIIVAESDSAPIYFITSDSVVSDYTNRPIAYTSRPTNTSVLYCIKY